MPFSTEADRNNPLGRRPDVNRGLWELTLKDLREANERMWALEDLVRFIASETGIERGPDDYCHGDGYMVTLPLSTEQVVLLDDVLKEEDDE